MKKEWKLFYKDQRTNVLILIVSIVINLFQMMVDEDMKELLDYANGLAPWMVPIAFLMSVSLQFVIIKIILHLLGVFRNDEE